MPLRDIEELLRRQEDDDEDTEAGLEATAPAPGAPVRPAPASERFAPRIEPEARIEALKTLVPQSRGTLDRFSRGAFGDLGELAQGYVGLITLPFTEAGRETIKHGAKALISEPGGPILGPLTAATKFLGKAFVEDYTPREGESVWDVVTRRTLDDPLLTLSDIATVGTGTGLGLKVAGSAAKIAKLSRIGEAVVNASTSLDPINALYKGGQAIARTKYPSYMRQQEVRNELQEATYRADIIKEAIINQNNADIKAFYGRMSPEERAYFPTYTQGKMSLMPPTGGELDQFGERMAQHMAEWEQIQTRVETTLNLHPETIAQERVLQEARRIDTDPAFADPAVRQQRLDEVHETEFAKAEEQRLLRRTQPLRDAVYDAKKAEWNKGVDKMRLEGLAATTVEQAHWLNPMPDIPGPGKPGNRIQQILEGSIDPHEILNEFAGGQGALYVPHSAEVLTKAQQTFGAVSSKLREAQPWKYNRGALQRAGVLEVLEPHEPLRRLQEKLQTALERGNPQVEKLVRAEMGKLGDPLLRAMLNMNEQAASHANYVDVMNHVINAYGGEKVPRDKARFTELAKDKRFAGDAKTGEQATHQFLHPNGRYQMYTLSHELDTLFDGMRKRVDAGDEAASVARFDKLLDNASARAPRTMGVRKGETWAVPREAAEIVHEHMTQRFKPTSGLMRLWDNLSDNWRFITLPLRPAWLRNNLIGGATFNAMAGIHPLNPATYSAHFKAFQGVAYDHFGWFGERGRQLSAIRKLPGVAQGGMVEKAFTEGTRNVAARFKASRNPAKRFIGRVGAAAAQFNTDTDAFFRSVAAIYKLEKNAKANMKATGRSFLNFMDQAERIDDLYKMGAQATMKQDDWDAALKFMNDTHANYRKQDPHSRRILRSVMPFHAFWKHAVKMTWRFPFEQPIAAKTIRTLAQMAREDLNDQLDVWGFESRDIPHWLQDSIPVDVVEGPDGQQVLRMFNTRGPDPSSVLSSNDPGADLINQLDPVLSTAIETVLGVDLFRFQRVRGRLTTHEGQEFDPKTGGFVPSMARQNPVDNFLMNFWPYKMTSDIVAGGRVKRDDSTLLDQILDPDDAYRKDSTTQRQIQRPFSLVRTLAAPIEPPLAFIERPTKQQRATESGKTSQILNTIWRDASPEERRKIMQTLQAARKKVAGQPKPAKPRAHPSVR